MDLSPLFFFVVLLLSFATSAMAAPEVLTIVSNKGEQMKVTLIGQDGKRFIVRRVTNRKKITIPPELLSPESKALLRDKLKTLQDTYPEIEAAVSVGKRSVNGSSSYYKRKQITGKVTLKNKDINRQCPPCSAHLIYIGQNQGGSKRYAILSNQKFDITPTSKGAIFTAVPFATSYDTDTDYSFGGYKYVGYLLIVLDKKKNVILTKTLHSQVKKAMEMSANLPKTMMKYSKGLIIDKMMVRAPEEDTTFFR